MRLNQSLGIGVEHAIGNAFEIAENHPVDGIAATAANTDDLNLGVLAGLDPRGIKRCSAPHLHRRGRFTVGWLHYVPEGFSRLQIGSKRC